MKTILWILKDISDIICTIFIIFLYYFKTRTKTITYYKDDIFIRFVGMRHVATKKFYNEVYSEIEEYLHKKDHALLAEGVKVGDNFKIKKSLLFVYKEYAKSKGLVVQKHEHEYIRLLDHVIAINTVIRPVMV